MLLSYPSSSPPNAICEPDHGEIGARGWEECYCVQISMPVKGFASQGLRQEGLSGCVAAKRAILGELARRDIHAK